MGNRPPSEQRYGGGIRARVWGGTQLLSLIGPKQRIYTASLSDTRPTSAHTNPSDARATGHVALPRHSLKSPQLDPVGGSGRVAAPSASYAPARGRYKHDGHDKHGLPTEHGQQPVQLPLHHIDTYPLRPNGVPGGSFACQIAVRELAAKFLSTRDERQRCSARVTCTILWSIGGMFG